MSDKRFSYGDLEKQTSDIEGVILRINNAWVAVFDTGSEDSADLCRSQIDYCPWCGKDIRGLSEHSH